MGKLPTALRQSLVALTDQSFVKTLELNELDDTTISALHKLVFAAEHNQCLPALDEDSIAAQIAEYEHEASRLQQQLQFIGLSEDRLPEDAAQALHHLAGASSRLNLAHATDGSVAAAWAMLLCQDLKARNAQEKLSQQEDVLQSSIARVQEAQQDVRKVQGSLSEELTAKHRELQGPNGPRTRINEYNNKVERYKKEYEQITNKLESKGWKAELAHHMLVDKSKAVEAQQAELAALKSKLATYQDLPPSQLGAELRLRQTHEQLNAVRSKLQRGMSDLS